MTVSFIEACFPCQEYSMGLKLTTRDPENFGLLILGFAGGTAGWPACRAVGQLRGWVE
jgi:hypothetical protein